MHASDESKICTVHSVHLVEMTTNLTCARVTQRCYHFWRALRIEDIMLASELTSDDWHSLQLWWECELTKNTNFIRKSLPDKRHKAVFKLQSDRNELKSTKMSTKLHSADCLRQINRTVQNCSMSVHFSWVALHGLY